MGEDLEFRKMIKFLEINRTIALRKKNDHQEAIQRSRARSVGKPLFQAPPPRTWPSRANAMLSGNGDQNVSGKVCFDCGGPWEPKTHKCPRDKNNWDLAKAKAASEEFKQKRWSWTANSKPIASHTAPDPGTTNDAKYRPYRRNNSPAEPGVTQSSGREAIGINRAAATTNTRRTRKKTTAGEQTRYSLAARMEIL